MQFFLANAKIQKFAFQAPEASTGASAGDDNKNDDDGGISANDNNLNVSSQQEQCYILPREAPQVYLSCYWGEPEFGIESMGRSVSMGASKHN